MKSVDILLATYKPNMVYFEKLLSSLNMQSYSNINLIVRDDSDDEKVYDTIAALVDKSITAFSYQIIKNDKNIGSNKTFEQLTKDASAEYIAFCDQDDIWEKEKIEKLVNVIKKEDAVLSYSDLSIIDENDILIANSFKDIHKRLKHLDGNNLFDFFLRRNSVTGCTMLIKSVVAKAAIALCNEFYTHDQWLTLYASSIGKIAYTSEPLIRYRIHGENQIGATMLTGIESREDYIEKKLMKERDKYIILIKCYNFNDNHTNAIKNVLSWTEERINFFEKKSFRNTISMLKKIRDDYQLILLEIAINLAPNMVGKKIIEKIKK